MALPVLPILKALAPLVTNAASIAATLRGAAAAKLDDRVGKLERETIRAGEVLAALAEQLQAVAEQLRVAAEQTHALARRATLTLSLAVAALLVSVAALVVALSQG